MNDCPKEKNLWNKFSYMIMGIALFEFTSKLITHLEANGDYTSPLYAILLTLTTLGLMIAINYGLTIYIQIKKNLPISNPKPQEKLDLTFFHLFFQTIKELFKIVKQSLRHFTNYIH